MNFQFKEHKLLWQQQSSAHMPEPFEIIGWRWVLLLAYDCNLGKQMLLF